jgi:prepilin-type N-terminal cleavage/methylation domain-containing protein/prepilin-type processing-associated H-X9-DG protein
MISRTHPSRSAFTLIELLVVIAIISLLVSILLPSLQKAKQLANRVHCLVRLRSIGSVYFLYQSDFDGRGPVGFTWGSSDSREAEPGWPGWPSATGNPYYGGWGWFWHKETDENGNPCWALGEYLGVGSPGYTKLPVACTNNEQFVLDWKAGTTYAVNAQLGFDMFLGDCVQAPASTPMLMDGTYPNLADPNSRPELGYMAFPNDLWGWAPFDIFFLDQASFSHEGSGNFLFFDGHAENQKALDSLEDYLNLWTWGRPLI